MSTRFMASSATALRDDDHRCQKADPDGASDHPDPFRRPEETVLGVVGQRQHEVARRTRPAPAGRPTAPTRPPRVIDHAVQDQQEAEPRCTTAARRTGAV